MKFTIKKITSITILDDNRLITKNGYAFIDEHDHTIIIVYGDTKKVLISNYLNNNL